MSGEANKAVARRFFEEVWNRGNLDAIDELVAPGAVAYDAGNALPAHGIEGTKERVAGYRAAFPDTHFSVEAMIAEGDRVVSRWTCRCTHRGPFMGLPPTGRPMTVTGITIDRIGGGRIVESWINWDTLGLLRQIGAI